LKRKARQTGLARFNGQPTLGLEFLAKNRLGKNLKYLLTGGRVFYNLPPQVEP
jgi:hypothetical protein